MWIVLFVQVEIKNKIMKNKGRRHKSGNGPHASGNCKGELCGITRPIEQISSRNNVMGEGSKKWMKKKWSKRVRGYFKSQTKELI